MKWGERETKPRPIDGAEKLAKLLLEDSRVDELSRYTVREYLEAMRQQVLER